MLLEQHSYNKALESLEKAREEAESHAIRLMRFKIGQLNEKYKRHKFRYVDGMGTWFIYVTPAFFGQNILDVDSPHWSGWQDKKIGIDFVNMCNDIIDFGVEASDLLSFDFGEIEGV